MNNVNLVSRLQSLRSRYVDQFAHLQDEAKSLEGEIQRMSMSLRELEIQRELASQKFYQVQNLLQGLANAENEETLELILASFLSCQQELKDALGVNFDNRLELQNKIQILLDRNPNLELALQEYNQFNANFSTVLANVPAYYREKLIASHDKLREKLSDILELRSQLEKYFSPVFLNLPIVQTINHSDGQVYWALPSPYAVNENDELFVLRMNALENAFLRSMAILAGDSETILPDFDRCRWAGYRGITTLCEENDNRALAQFVQEHLVQSLTELWPFPDRPIQFDVISVDWGLWVAGQEKVPALEPINLGGADEDLKFKTANLLFHERDVLSWDRPLRGGEDSAWTVTARRLRTLFIRLIAQGRIGGMGLPTDAFLSGLPVVHREAVDKILQTLLDKGVLVTKSAELELYFVNPDFLADIQDLINRDVTPLWAPIVEEVSQSVVE